MNISGQEFIQAMLVLVLDRVLQQVMVQQQSDVTQVLSQISLQLCYLDRPLPRLQVFMVSP